MKRGAMNCVMGGQAGSEAKGKMAAYLVGKFNITRVAGNFSPNAGHTVIRDGKKHVTYHIPAGIYGARNMSKMSVSLGPASVINPTIFLREVEELRQEGFIPRRLFLDSRATIVTQGMIRKEQERMTDIGSTAQGVGEARCTRLMRTECVRAGSIEELDPFTMEEIGKLLLDYLKRGATVLYEMTQGFDLCIDHGVDPIYCTSRNCTPMQALADMGIPPRYLGDVYAVIRPYPIRVNNRTGSSGPYPSREITWEDVRKRCGAPYDIMEFTTTTKLKRRVFEFSWDQVKRMTEVCNPDFFCLQFANYLSWSDFGMTEYNKISAETLDFISKLESRTGISVAYVGTGPSHEHMIDMGIDE